MSWWFSLPLSEIESFFVDHKWNIVTWAWPDKGSFTCLDSGKGSQGSQEKSALCMFSHDRLVNGTKAACPLRWNLTYESCTAAVSSSYGMSPGLQHGCSVITVTYSLWPSLLYSLSIKASHSWQGVCVGVRNTGFIRFKNACQAIRTKIHKSANTYLCYK